MPIQSNQAAGEGFEPPSEVAPAAGFQDRCLQPLGHPAGCLILSAVGAGVVAVAHRLGGWHEVRHQPLGDGRGRRRLLDGGGHVNEPIHRMARRAFGRRIASRLETERRRLRPKERDARRAVETALSGTPASPGPRRLANTSGPSTSFLQRFKEQAIRPPGPHAHAERATVLQSWFAAQLLHPDCADFVRWLRLRFLLFSEATYAGVPVAAGRHALLVRTLRAYHERRCGSAWLPSLEYDDEARIHAMAEAAVESFGSGTSVHV